MDSGLDHEPITRTDVVGTNVSPATRPDDFVHWLPIHVVMVGGKTRKPYPNLVRFPNPPIEQRPGTRRKIRGTLG